MENRDCQDVVRLQAALFMQAHSWERQMLCESQPASEEERSQGPTGMQEEHGCASMPEGAVSPARNSSFAQLFGRPVGKPHSLSLMNALG